MDREEEDNGTDNKDNDDEDNSMEGCYSDICNAFVIGGAYTSAGERNVEAAQLLTKGNGGERALHTPPPPRIWPRKLNVVVIVGRGGGESEKAKGDGN